MSPIVGFTGFQIYADIRIYIELNAKRTEEYAVRSQ